MQNQNNELSNFPVFEFTDDDEGKVAFPPGRYLFAIGKISPRENERGKSVAVELWCIKYSQSEKTAPEQRINYDQSTGKVTMQNYHGRKRTEYFVPPSENKKMAWKAMAFFSKFNCIKEDFKSFDANGNPVTKKTVDWDKAIHLYGHVFSASITQRKSGDNVYSNIDYGSIEPTENTIPSDVMEKIEALYESLLPKDETNNTDFVQPSDADDLPF